MGARGLAACQHPHICTFLEDQYNMSRSEFLPRPFLANPCVSLTVSVSPTSVGRRYQYLKVSLLRNFPVSPLINSLFFEGSVEQCSQTATFPRLWGDQLHTLPPAHQGIQPSQKRNGPQNSTSQKVNGPQTPHALWKCSV